MHVCVCACTYGCIHACTNVCMYVTTCTNVNIITCTNTCTHTQNACMWKCAIMHILKRMNTHTDYTYTHMRRHVCTHHASTKTHMHTNLAHTSNSNDMHTHAPTCKTHACMYACIHAHRCTHAVICKCTKTSIHK